MAYAHAVAGASVTTDRQEGLAQLYAAERQQMDNLCGCFWATLALRAAGIDADQDGVAVAAGAILPGGDPQTHVAPGATPRNDYRVELPVDSTPGRRRHRRAGGRTRDREPVPGRPGGDPGRRPVDGRDRAGPHGRRTRAPPSSPTSAPGSSGARTCLRGRCSRTSAARTSSRPPPTGTSATSSNFAALVRGPAGDLVVVRDTYQELGLDGHHLQPPDRVAAALRRDDGHEGGVLAVVESSAAPALRERLERERLRASPLAQRHP